MTTGTSRIYEKPVLDQTENLPGSERGNQRYLQRKNLWSTGKMEAFGQRDGAHGREFTVDDHKVLGKR